MVGGLYEIPELLSLAIPSALLCPHSIRNMEADPFTSVACTVLSIRFGIAVLWGHIFLPMRHVTPMQYQQIASFYHAKLAFEGPSLNCRQELTFTCAYLSFAILRFRSVSHTTDRNTRSFFASADRN
jgi:hypothetical protein